MGADRTVKLAAVFLDIVEEKQQLLRALNVTAKGHFVNTAGNRPLGNIVVSYDTATPCGDRAWAKKS